MLTRLLLICILLSFCATQRMVQTDLYFGISKPDGSTVSTAEWNTFKENQLSRVFKEGSTVIDATGNWRDTQSGQLVTEPTHVVVYLRKPSKKISRQIDTLRQQYKTAFNQQSVLRVDKKVAVSF